MGTKTINAINAIDSHKLFNVYQAKRILYYTDYVKKYPSQKVFEKGWIARVKSIKFED